MAENLWIVAAGVDKFFQMSGFSSTLKQSISSSDATPSDISTDNNTNLLSVGDTADKIFLHSGLTVTITNSFTVPLVSYAYGITWFGGNVYHTAYGDVDKCFKFSGFSSTITDSFTQEDSIEGCTYDSTDFYTAMAGAVDDIRRYSGFSNTIKDSLSFSRVDGITTDATYLYRTDLVSDKAFKHSGFQLATVDSFTVPDTFPVGMEWEEYSTRTGGSLPTPTPSTGLGMGMMGFFGG